MVMNQLFDNNFQLGAVEFLRKPLSEDKLRNLWQHVVHKVHFSSAYLFLQLTVKQMVMPYENRSNFVILQAFNAGGSALSDSLKPVKESVVSMLHLKLENGESKNEKSENTEYVSVAQQSGNEQPEANDKYPAPSTPQLKQGGRLLDDVDCQDNTNCSIEKESAEQDGESKFVETTCDNSTADGTLQENQPQRPRETLVKEEHDPTNGSKTECNMLPLPCEKENLKGSSCVIENRSKASGLQNACGNKANRKKMKVILLTSFSGFDINLEEATSAL